MISEFVECVKKGGINSFVPQQRSLFHMTWLFCCWFFSFSQTIVKTKWWIWFWMIYHSVCIIVTKRVWMNTTLVFNVFVWSVWKRHIIHIDSFDTICDNYENGITINNKNNEKWKQMKVRIEWRRERKIWFWREWVFEEMEKKWGLK